MRRIIGIVVALLLLATFVRAADPADKPNDKPAAKPKLTQEELEKQFAETMTGSTMIGHFTTGEGKGPQAEERYTLSKVAKVQGDTWLFTTRIQYGGHDATLPLPLEVKWAGDTPMITLTDMAIPGFGTFTARVLIYRGQYAGTWSGGDHGGHLFGKIVKEPADKDAPEKKPSEKSSDAPSKTPAAPKKR